MVDNVKESGVFPVNSNGEIVLQSGTGDNIVAGYIPSNQIPSDTTTNKVVVKLPSNAATYEYDGSGNVTGLAIGDATNIGIPTDTSFGTYIFISLTKFQQNPAAIQEAHDALKLLGGGNVVLQAGKTYAPVSTVSLDVSYVGLKLNGAKINISGVGSGNAWLNVYGSSDIHDEIGAVNREISGGWIIGNFVTGDSAGVSGIRFDSQVASTSTRCVLRNMRVRGCYKGAVYGNRSYFVFWYDSFIHDNGIGIHQEAGASDFAEKNTFINCVIAENDIQLQDLGGNVWKFFSTSFDYHASRLFDLRAGANVTLNDCHLEWSYGASVSETNSPIKLTGPNTTFVMRGGAMMYQGSGQNPYYASHVSTDNTSQIVDISLDKPSKLGRLTDTASLDSLSIASSLVFPYVRLRAISQGQSVNDLPSMSHYSDSGAGAGVGGLLRNGVDTPFNELSHRIAVTGTAAVSSVVVDENGVTRKGSAGMIKITGQGKVCINLPIFEAGRRHVWEFFTNPAFLTGSVTIKERQTAYATKFDGTTITNVVDVRGAAYSGTTVTVSNGANAWTRRSWKHCNPQETPSPRQSMASVVQIEIDTTLMTAGALYLSHFAYDVF